MIGPILTLYLEFVRSHRGLAQKTARKYIQKLSAFAQYLEGVGVTQLCSITPRHVREFYENAGHGGPRRSYGSTLRVFFRWAAVQGWVADSLGDAVPRPRQYRHVNLPDVLSAAEVERILAAVDQSTALGRRDYAILLLAARYGLRPCDIRQLALDDIDWRSGRIDLRQLKTGRPVPLPLMPDVAIALSEYIRNGRPVSSHRTLFLRHRAPFEPFAPENNLIANMREPFRALASPDELVGGACTCSATHLPHGFYVMADPAEVPKTHIVGTFWAHGDAGDPPTATEAHQRRCLPLSRRAHSFSGLCAALVS